MDRTLEEIEERYEEKELEIMEDDGNPLHNEEEDDDGP